MPHVAEITMLGTGSAFPRESYNSCFVIRDKSMTMLVDAGGGIEILRRLRDAAIDVREITHMMVTHVHTDHILGAVWVIRSIINKLSYDGVDASREKLHFYGNADVISAFKTICRLTFLKSNYDVIDRVIEFDTIADGDKRQVGDTEVEFFDVGSANVSQTGFRMTFPTGQTVVCLGDEAVTEHNLSHASGASWLLCGAYCRYADRERFHPYEKHHYTVRDVARLAESAGVGNLVMYHSEDATDDRRELYTAEASEFYRGNIFVPDDGDTLFV